MASRSAVGSMVARMFVALLAAVATLHGTAGAAPAGAASSTASTATISAIAGQHSYGFDLPTTSAANTRSAALRPRPGQGTPSLVSTALISPSLAAKAGAGAKGAFGGLSLEQLGDRHADITGAQSTLYRQLAASGQPLSWKSVAAVERQALVAAGMDARMAGATVNRAIGTLRKVGVQGPTRIPWGG